MKGHVAWATLLSRSGIVSMQATEAGSGGCSSATLPELSANLFGGSAELTARTLAVLG